MAEYTPEEIATLGVGFATLATPAKAVIEAHTSEETNAAISKLIARTRGATTAAALQSSVTLSISSWPTLNAVYAAMPGGTLYEDARAAKAEFDAQNAAGLGPKGMTALLALFRHVGL